MGESDFKISIIGLGIMGGSMAYALRGFRNAKIVGCDKDALTREMAVKSGAVSEAVESAADAIKDADIVILCVYPELIVKLVTENADNFKDGAIITDVCGVKMRLSEELLGVVPEKCEYIGGHPMAGRETDGFKSAIPELFGMCGYIITPMVNATKRGIDTVREIASYIGAARIVESTPREHDEIIAYTSDLMHLSAAALCLDYNGKMSRAYTAGAFRDCTRIANINPRLWSGLFLENKEFLQNEIERLLSSVNKFKTAIENNDRAEIERLLSIVRDNKLTMQNKER